jgi:fibrillarin-like pre-rRNA processing protein
LGLTTTEHSPGVYFIEGEGQRLLATRNLALGRKVYGEELIEIGGVEYRLWNPSRSKLGAAIMKGLRNNPIVPGSKVLYLGVASGTTCSHVSDIIGKFGHVWGVDFAPRPIRDLIDHVARYRKNISPILGDARQPQGYSLQVPKVEVLFADVAQPDQAEIVVKNAKLFLKKSGYAMFSIKSRSIDVSREPAEIFREQVRFLEASGLSVEELVELDPFEKDHALALASLV